MLHIRISVVFFGRFMAKDDHFAGLSSIGRPAIICRRGQSKWRFSCPSSQLPNVQTKALPSTLLLKEQMNPSNFKQSGHNLSIQAARALMQIANPVLQSGPQLFFLNLFSERLPFHRDRSRKAGFIHHPRSSMSSDLWQWVTHAFLVSHGNKHNSRLSILCMQGYRSICQLHHSLHPCLKIGNIYFLMRQW